MKLLAAMSGGVDSAVAAARAVDAGHEVTGVHLALSQSPSTLRTGARGCCTVEDANDARRAADVMGIPFYIWDLAERFREDVVEDFVAEYEAGRTPNPCLRCNEKIKFTAVLDRALALGFDAVVTGHHARLVDGRLYRSVDEGKDQSYVLAVLRPDQLAHAVFPLADSTKDQVRAEAAARGSGGSGQAGLARHLLHRRRRHPRLPGPSAGRRARRHRRCRDRPGLGTASGHLRLHRRPAPRPRPDRHVGRPAALRALALAQDEHGHRRPGERAGSRRGAGRRRRCGPPGSRRRRTVALTVQLRAHGMVSPARSS